MYDLKDLPRLIIFLEVAKQGSFTEGAKKLGLKKSGTSLHITSLEERLQVQLLNRSTRGIQLTEAGERLFWYCNLINNHLIESFNELQEIDQQPKGALSITAPHSLEQHIILPVMMEYCEQFPQIKPCIITDDRPLDLIKNNIDVSIHLGKLNDSNYRARSIGTISDVLCASPEYIARNDPINDISDLYNHKWVAAGWQQIKTQYNFKKKGEDDVIAFDVPQDMRANTLPAACKMVELGMGIGMLPDIFAVHLIKSGRLVQILPEIKCTCWPVYAVHPYHGKVPKKIKVLIDSIETKISEIKAIAKDLPGFNI
ncbi:LysR family transcriptional regulator [Sessilibacter corallicola]|uniref:LysR family transcriptional regulator n=1 Tax=Sessilibacter corallicola TaxID=2904075 RepID=UPI001E5E5F70|nr:LysR family transcriptional regulator [Sessilibacter corallicola]MCE2028324.1 LysR family transcriptional regulator [Sessilibacter corallicola]